MTPSPTFSEYTAHLRAFMERSAGRPPADGSDSNIAADAPALASCSRNLQVALGFPAHEPERRSPDRPVASIEERPADREIGAPRFRDSIRERINPTTVSNLEAPTTDIQFNLLALSLFTLQFAHNLPYQKFCQSRRVSPDTVTDWSEIPAIPTAAFKELELTSLPTQERTVVFHSSGTTTQQPSRHFHNAESLAIYQASLLPWFRAHLLAGLDESGQGHSPVTQDKPPFICLTPTPAQAPHSSLAYMFDTVRRELGSPDSVFTGNVDPRGAWQLDVDKTVAALRECAAANRQVILLGTAFSFVHLLDQLAETKLHLSLPPGSRVLETGGYKGRSRTLPKAELHALITQFLGIPAARITCEYGMSELSSQAYDRVAGSCANSQRLFQFPPWTRVKIISPETGREVTDGETGLLRIYDLANVRSVMAIQTEDLAVRHGDGFELIGRAASAEPRGCSLMASADSH